MNPEVEHNKVRGVKSGFAGAARLMSDCAAATLIAFGVNLGGFEFSRFGAPAFLTGRPSFMPSSGPIVGGTLVTIYGSDFSTRTAVLFGQTKPVFVDRGVSRLQVNKRD